jgi:hypothetical protein
MLDFKRVAHILGGLTLLKFFPADPNARLELAKLVGRIAATEQQVEWLVQRMLDLYSEWPGPHELRAVLCSRYRPVDGINAVSGSYPDGIPHDPRLKIAAAPVLELPPGHKVSVDPELENMITASVKKMPKKMPAIPPTPAVGADGRFVQTLRDIETAPCDRESLPGPAPQIITQADIDAAVAANRAKAIAQ